MMTCKPHELFDLGYNEGSHQYKTVEDLSDTLAGKRADMRDRLRERAELIARHTIEIAEELVVEQDEGLRPAKPKFTNAESRKAELEKRMGEEEIEQHISDTQFQIDRLQAQIDKHQRFGRIEELRMQHATALLGSELQQQMHSREDVNAAAAAARIFEAQRDDLYEHLDAALVVIEKLYADVDDGVAESLEFDLLAAQECLLNVKGEEVDLLATEEHIRATKADGNA